MCYRLRKMSHTPSRSSTRKADEFLAILRANSGAFPPRKNHDSPWLSSAFKAVDCRPNVGVLQLFQRSLLWHGTSVNYRPFIGLFPRLSRLFREAKPTQFDGQVEWLFRTAPGQKRAPIYDGGYVPGDGWRLGCNLRLTVPTLTL